MSSILFLWQLNILWIFDYLILIQHIPHLLHLHFGSFHPSGLKFRLSFMFYSSPFHSNLSTHVRKIWPGREMHFNPEEYDFKCNFTYVQNMTSFFPKYLLTNSMLNMSGYACKLRYNRFQATPGTYSLRLAASPRMLQQMKHQYGLQLQLKSLTSLYILKKNFTIVQK